MRCDTELGILVDVNTDASGKLWSLGKRTSAQLQSSDEWEAEGNSISWYRCEAVMYRWLETLEQKHVDLQRNILFCQKMSLFWTTAANDIPPVELGELGRQELAAFQARGLRQAAIYNDLGRLALRKFEEVAHPTLFTLESHLGRAIDDFRQDQLKWMRPMGIERADLVSCLQARDIRCPDQFEDFWFESGGDILQPSAEEETLRAQWQH